MTDITSLQQFSQMISQYRKSYPKSVSNCLLMPGEISQLCEENALYADEKDGFFKILCVREDYCSFYYYLAENAQISDTDALFSAADGKDILLDFVFSQKRGQTTDRAVEAMLSCGLIKEYKSYQRMTFPLQEASDAHYFYQTQTGYTLSDSYFDYDEISALWKTALDERSTPLPNKDELEKLCGDGLVLSILDENSKLCAVGMLTVSGRQALIEHIAVSPLHRRQGLAKFLLGRLILLAKQRDIRVLRLWVDINNLPAVSLYNREGFTHDGIICNQYLFTERNV